MRILLSPCALPRRDALRPHLRFGAVRPTLPRHNRQRMRAGRAGSVVRSRQKFESSNVNNSSTGHVAHASRCTACRSGPVAFTRSRRSPRRTCGPRVRCARPGTWRRACRSRGDAACACRAAACDGLQPIDGAPVRLADDDERFIVSGTSTPRAAAPASARRVPSTRPAQAWPP